MYWTKRAANLYKLLMPTLSRVLDTFCTTITFHTKIVLWLYTQTSLKTKTQTLSHFASSGNGFKINILIFFFSFAVNYQERNCSHLVNIWTFSLFYLFLTCQTLSSIASSKNLSDFFLSGLKIKRPYFHVKPLDRLQVRAWHSYLDWEIAQLNKDTQNPDQGNCMMTILSVVICVTVVKLVKKSSVVSSITFDTVVSL